MNTGSTESTGSVSYTHLAVYKRQVLHEELFSGSSRLRERDGEQAMTSLAREVIRWEDSSRESKALKMESYYILGR